MSVVAVFEGGPLDGRRQQMVEGLGLHAIPVMIGGEERVHEYGEAAFLDPSQPAKNDRGELRLVYIRQRPVEG